MGLTDALRRLAEALKRLTNYRPVGSPGVNAWAREKCFAELEHLRAHP